MQGYEKKEKTDARIELTLEIYQTCTLTARPKCVYGQRWSPRERPWPPGHILKSLASKIKSLASRLKFSKLACPRLQDSTILLIVKSLWSAWKIFWKTFFCGDRLKKFFEVLFFWDRLKKFSEVLFFGEHLRLCPWSLASNVPVLDLESVCPRKSCPWPWPRIFFMSLALASSLVSSTAPLFTDKVQKNKITH